ncbi:MAG TPA: hypothetical protein VMG30_10965 [Acidobacteriota bacterium]|nr:hypothetical protein [Acidobacteriota bacterium]
MSLKSIIQRFSNSSVGKKTASQVLNRGHRCIYWPLPETIPICQFFPPLFGDEMPQIGEAQAHGSRAQEEPEIEVFRDPFPKSEFAKVIDARSVYPSECAMPDGKCCEVVNEAGEVRYLSCRSYIDAIQKAENSLGGRWGIKVLRMLALDRFGYREQSEALYREWETNNGQGPAAMGYARVLLSHLHTARALDVIENALRIGLRGAALSACHARTLFECRRVNEGISAAAAAIAQLPDPLWMEADDHWTWGLLRGAADAVREENELRDAMVRAIQSIRDAAPSPECFMACASLAESAGDIEEMCRCAKLAINSTGGNKEVLEEAEKCQLRGHTISALALALQRSPDKITDVRAVQLNIAGWLLDAPNSDARHALWKNEQGDEISLSFMQPIELSQIAGEKEVRTFCRQQAERASAGLVQGGWILGQLGRTIQMIYKRLEGRAFTFIGLQIVPVRNASLCWKSVAKEQGITGTREATVTKQMFEQGRMTLEAYSKSWAADPFDSAYSGVDHKTLRYFSDDVFFDCLFPDHPLSRVRRTLRALCTSPGWDEAHTRDG